MSSLPVVWCFSNATHPTPASSHILRLYAEHFTGDFILLDQVPVTKMSEKEREHVQGILCTGGFTQSKAILGKEIMDLLPNLKVISTPSTGINHIEVEAASAHGIRVGHAPGHFVSDCVAEFAFGLLLASARSIIDADKVAKSSDITSLQLTVGHTPMSATRTCVMHQSIPAMLMPCHVCHVCLSVRPPPSRANPQALAFFWKKWANSPGWGHMSCLNAPGRGRRKRANAQLPRLSPSNTSAVFILIGEFVVL